MNRMILRTNGGGVVRVGGKDDMTIMSKYEEWTPDDDSNTKVEAKVKHS
jgi:hypothetical protein